LTTSNKILLIIFLATVIPTAYIYFEHAAVEVDAYYEAKTDVKKIKTLGEAILFTSISIGYVILMWLIVFLPKYRIPYIVIIVGTIAIVILYYLRIYGIPIPFTDIVITDFSSDWRDVVTKIAQQIMLVPVSMMLAYRNRTTAC
jgi:hypothetical protein